ncbi:MAG: putative DNA modification/repair radical SAM protein [Candidatus Woesearchaeota archaeon]
MEILDKVKLLSESSKYDLCASSASKRKTTTDDRIGNAASGGICHSFTADGRCVSLFKTLMSNECSYDCRYCQNTGCTRRKTATYEPKQLAKVFMRLYVKNYVEGLFLSSGVIRDPDRTTENMLDAVKYIRERYKFHGYIHFKALPGVNQDLLKQCSEYADRMSINLEVPNSSRMPEISHIKDFKSDIIRRQRWISRLKIPSGQTTQMVVGSSDESDLEILNAMKWEYDNVKLRRAYFSAFTPIEGTPLEKKSKTPLLRENRLYNTDWLLRVYKFRFKEIKEILNDKNNLPKDDPKIHIARNYFDSAVDINEAGYNDLIRIPGIGINSAYKIMELQEKGIRIEKKTELKQMGIVVKRAEPFITINGYQQKTLANFA